MNELVEKHIMDNGLEVYFYSDKTKHTANASLYISYGGRDKDFITNGKRYHLEDGMAHLLEHLVCEHSYYGNLGHLYGDKNMPFNARTSYEDTCYYFKTTNELEYGLEKLLLAVNKASFSNDDILITKKPIYEEIRECLDSEGRLVSCEIQKNLFCNSDYISGIGTIEAVKKFDKELINICYNTFYQPKNEKLFISGAFDTKKILSLVKKVCKKLENKNDFEKVMIPDVAQVKEESSEIILPVAMPSEYVVYKIDIKKWNAYKKYTACFYLDYFLRMNFGGTSKLHDELLNKEIIYGRIGFGWFIQDDFIVVKVSAVTDKLLEFKEIVCNVLEGDYILDEEWFELYKKDAKMSILKRFESHSGVLGNFHYNKDCSGLEKIDEVSDINKFNFAGFKEFIDQLGFKYKTVITVVDEK